MNTESDKNHDNEPKPVGSCEPGQNVVVIPPGEVSLVASGVAIGLTLGFVLGALFGAKIGRR